MRQRGREGVNLRKSVFGQWAGLGGSETGAYLRDCALAASVGAPPWDDKALLHSAFVLSDLSFLRPNQKRSKQIQELE